MMVELAIDFQSVSVIPISLNVVGKSISLIKSARALIPTKAISSSVLPSGFTPQTLTANMPVKHRVDDCQTEAVVAVSVCAELVFKHMTLEVRDLAELQNTVFAHRRRPNQFGADEFLIGIFERCTHILNDVAHNRLVDLIAEVCFSRRAEVGFHAMAEGVERAGDDLLHRHGHSVADVEDSEVVKRAP